nr:unnamed protein product [Callosobruchus analis]
MIFLTAYSAYSVRVNISLLIISMVETETGQEIPECLIEVNRTRRVDGEFRVLEFEDLVVRSHKGLLPDHGPRFNWDENTQGLILSGYFYAYLISSLIGGKLVSWLGPVRVIFWTQLCSAVINSAIPVLAKIDFSVVVALRFLLGIGGGFIYPSLHVLISRWAPPDEKGKFMAATMGSHFGTYLTWFLVGEIVEACGWPWGFHFVSLENLIFCVIFYLICSDSPENHCWISDLEKEYIRRSQAGSVSSTKFMAEVIGFNLIESGLLAGVPHMTRMFVGMLVSYLSDKMYLRGVRHSFIRRFFAFFSHVAAGLLMTGISYVGCHWDHIVVLFIFSMALNGCNVVVNLVNAQDLSPNYVGIIYSLISALGATAGIIVPAVTGAVLEQKVYTEGVPKVDVKPRLGDRPCLMMSYHYYYP